MKAIFYNYQSEDENRENIFETKIDIIPKKGDGISFPWDGSIHFANVISIDHCFDLNAKFTHIDIELDTF